jgi:hypothetical protein
MQRMPARQAALADRSSAQRAGDSLGERFTSANLRDLLSGAGRSSRAASDCRKSAGSSARSLDAAFQEERYLFTNKGTLPLRSLTPFNDLLGQL